MSNSNILVFNDVLIELLHLVLIFFDGFPKETILVQDLFIEDHILTFDHLLLSVVLEKESKLIPTICDKDEAFPLASNWSLLTSLMCG